jgi:hypothetical protein
LGRDTPISRTIEAVTRDWQVDTGITDVMIDMESENNAIEIMRQVA